MDEKYMETASALEQMHRDAAIAASAPKPEPVPEEFDGVHCAEPECGEEIHPVRLAMGKFRCTDCQTRKETRRG